MLLVSDNVEQKYKVIKKIREENDKIKADVFYISDLKHNSNYKKYEYVITEYNVNKIDYFTNLGKKVIICCSNNMLIDSTYKNRKDITICKSKKELINIINKRVSKRKVFYNPFSFKPVPICLTLVIMFCVFLGVSRCSFLQENVTDKLDEQKGSENKKEAENYVFLGDSITDFYDLEKFYGDLPVVNSGISGNQYKDLLYHLDERVFKYNPTKVFILIWTNDIAFTEITNEELVDRIIEICDEIHKEEEKTEIYVESIYPVNRTEDNDIVDLNMVLRRDNERIQNINRLLKEKIDQSQYTYLDMYSKLVDENGNLALDYTYDGLHLSYKGYEVITENIKKIINKI